MLNGFKRHGRAITPALAKFMPAIHPGENDGWWLSGGISAANCLAAYQPVGAPSYAASKINLANPGTYDAAEGVAPTWNASSGWTFNGGTQYLTTSGLAPDDQDWSYIIQYASLANPGTQPAIFGEWDQVVNPSFVCIRLYAAVAQNRIRYYNGAYADVIPSPYPTAANLCIAGNKAYRDGVDEGVSIGAWNGSSPNQLYIGARNERGPAVLYCPVDVLAMAVYNTTLTADQVAALAGAMAAL